MESAKKGQPPASAGGWLIWLGLSLLVFMATCYAWTQHQREHAEALKAVAEINAKAEIYTPAIAIPQPDGSTLYSRCNGNGWCLESKHIEDVRDMQEDQKRVHAKAVSISVIDPAAIADGLRAADASGEATEAAAIRAVAVK